MQALAQAMQCMFASAVVVLCTCFCWHSKALASTMQKGDILSNAQAKSTAVRQTSNKQYTRTVLQHD
jgi:hypothetical protein